MFSVNNGLRPRDRLWERFGDFTTFASFTSFTAIGADRFSILLSLLKEAGLIDDSAGATVTLSGHRHIFVPAEGLDKKKAVILLAHYDCVAGSPGANDNAAAVFMLIEAARNLRKERVKDWLIVFTDKEELQKGERLTAQGSFSLARGMKEIGFKNNPCFIFDTVGRGETLVISTTAKYLLKESVNMSWSTESLSMRKAVEDLNYRALDAARRLNLSRLVLLPTPFSDDAGFFRAGFPAQTITVLPYEEVSPFQLLVRRNPQLIHSLVAAPSAAAESAGNDVSYPETWRLINSPRDTARTLTPAHFGMIEKVARVLCGG
jgi:Iap family predicted aminopeptidase